MKHYFTIQDTIDFLSKKMEINIGVDDICDFVSRRDLTPCFRYKGMLAWENPEYSSYRVDSNFHGYLTNYDLQDHFLQIYTDKIRQVRGRVFLVEVLSTDGIPDNLCENRQKSFYLLDGSSLHEAGLKSEQWIKANYEHASPFDYKKEATRIFEMTLLSTDILFSYTEIESIIKERKVQTDKVSEEKNAQAEPINAGDLIKGINDHMQHPEPLPIAKALPQITKIADSKKDDFEYSANNIRKRNEIKKDLQAMARVIAAHLWTNETEQTRIGDMADKVYREVVKFAPTGYMPETTKAVEDWIRCVAPSYATKGGRPPKTP